jgi:hypothetical protein
MENLSNELNEAVNLFFDKYKDLNDEITSDRPADDTWTPKEIIGHLIDSASNNHQRFVRLQIVHELVFPGYAEDNTRWLQVQRYNDMNFSDLLFLWKQYNVLLGHIIEKADVSRLDSCWIKPDGDSITLKDLMMEYVSHLKGHFQHFEETLREMSERT